MMNNDFWKDFYGWLDSATDEHIEAARQKAQTQLAEPMDREMKSDIRRMLRAINEEQLTRSDLVRFVKRRG